MYGNLVYILPHPKPVRVSHLLLAACLTLRSDAVQLHKNANHKDCGLTRSWFLEKGILFFFALELYKLCSSTSVPTIWYYIEEKGDTLQHRNKEPHLQLKQNMQKFTLNETIPKNWKRNKTMKTFIWFLPLTPRISQRSRNVLIHISNLRVTSVNIL